MLNNFKCLLLISAVVLLSFAAITNTYAQCTTELADRYTKETRQAEIKMLEAKQTLMDKDPEQWMPYEIQAFEYYSLWVIYGATMAYIAGNDFSGLPADITELTTQGYIIDWPENPYNNWEPLEILGFNDGFSAGNIAIEPAPASHRDGKSPYAFEMVIFGPEIEFAMYGSAEPLLMNEDWATVPDGALYMLGSG